MNSKNANRQSRILSKRARNAILKYELSDDESDEKIVDQNGGLDDVHDSVYVCFLPRRNESDECEQRVLQVDPFCLYPSHRFLI